MWVRKKAGITLEAVELKGPGQIQDDQGVVRTFEAGWWLLTTDDGRQWVVDPEYFKANYEEWRAGVAG